MIYEKHQRIPEALSLAIRLNDSELIRKDFHAPGNPYERMLLCQSHSTDDWIGR
jgi:hypothetical protein